LEVFVRRIDMENGKENRLHGARTGEMLTGRGRLKIRWFFLLSFESEAETFVFENWDLN
jgi:hypothetical protein